MGEVTLTGGTEIRGIMSCKLFGMGWVTAINFVYVNSFSNNCSASTMATTDANYHLPDGDSFRMAIKVRSPLMAHIYTTTKQQQQHK